MSAGSGASLSRASGCSSLIIRSRAPPSRIRGSSGACSMPSTVRSTTMVAPASAAMTGFYLLYRVRGAGRAHRHRCRLRRRRHHDVKGPRSEAGQGQRRYLDVDPARLGLGQNGDRFASADGAQFQHPGKGIDPLGLDAFSQHGPSPSSALPGQVIPWPSAVGPIGAPTPRRVPGSVDDTRRVPARRRFSRRTRSSRGTGVVRSR